MRILIYGAGALGQALGCLLAAKGHTIHLILRERFIDPIRSAGLTVSGIFGDFSAPAENLYLFSQIAQADTSYDYTLITTKSYDTATALKDIAQLEKRAGYVVSVQNGCGNIEQIEKVFGSRSLGARVITGFEIIHVGSVKITVSADAIHIGTSSVGTDQGPATQLAEAINGAGHPCICVDDIHQSLFAKLLYNCTLNPLGAILGVHYGALADNPETRRIMDKVIDETFAVIKALGGTTPWQDASSYREHFYSILIPATYHHRPSMLQDLENNKPTEVESLVGYVGWLGKNHGVATETCDMLASLVRFKEGKTKEISAEL